MPPDGGLMRRLSVMVRLRCYDMVSSSFEALEISELLQDRREIGAAMLGGDDMGKETCRDGLFILLLAPKNAL